MSLLIAIIVITAAFAIPRIGKALLLPPVLLHTIDQMHRPPLTARFSPVADFRDTVVISLAGGTPTAYSDPCGSLRRRCSRKRSLRSSTTIGTDLSSSLWFCGPNKGTSFAAVAVFANCGGRFQAVASGVVHESFTTGTSQARRFTFIYTKQEQGDLTSEQVKTLDKLVRKEFK